jgi:DegV family protein with EDD domain
MQIVTDSGADLVLSKKELNDLNIHVVPLSVQLDEITYHEGVDIEPEGFYQLLEESDGLPTTSQPSAGEFAEVYSKLAVAGEDILSIHITAGLSGTFNSAKAGAELVPEANVTVVDAKTLSGAAGWQVEAAARAAKAGWPIDNILTLIKHISDVTDTIYTVKELKYLIHGGRISHMKGLIASMLNLKPLIGVEKENGTYVQLGQTRSFGRALEGLVNLIKKQHHPGSSLRVQIAHSYNIEGAERLRDLMDKTFDCTWLPMAHISLVLGAHTGPSLVGIAFAPQSEFVELP